MKHFPILITLLCFFCSALANMASPWIKGSKIPYAYSSRDIDVISEHINVKLIDVNKAQFDISYTIQSDYQGKQIPLLFDTYDQYDYHEDNIDKLFKVWVDEVEVTIINIPQSINNFNIKQLVDSLRNNVIDYKYKNFEDNLKGFKYFEVDLEKGIHVIRIQYVATANGNLGGWVTEFSFEYNLKPARYWRSFKDLEIVVDASLIDFPVNVIIQDTTSISSVKSWRFNNLPQDEFKILLIPKISSFAQVMINFGPEYLTLLFIIIIFILHIYWVSWYRNKYLHHKFSFAVVFGSLVFPFVSCCFYIFSYSLIDNIIGIYASGRHGYIFLIFMLYPFVMPIYLLIIWFIDRTRKAQLKNEII